MTDGRSAGRSFGWAPWRVDRSPSCFAAEFVWVAVCRAFPDRRRYCLLPQWIADCVHSLWSAATVKINGAPVTARKWLDFHPASRPSGTTGRYPHVIVLSVPWVQMSALTSASLWTDWFRRHVSHRLSAQRAPTATASSILWQCRAMPCTEDTFSFWIIVYACCKLRCMHLYDWQDNVLW